MIVLIILSVSAFILNMLFTRKKINSYFMIFLMWLLFAFSYNTADYNIYYRRFYYNTKESTEPLFNLTIKLFNLLDLELRGYIIFVATLFVLTLAYIILKHSSSGLPFCLYFIYPFCMDITQIRNALAFVPIMFGFHYLLSDTKEDDLKYICCVLISIFLHYSGVFYFLFWICKKCNLKKIIIITSAGMAGIALSTNFNNLILLVADKLGASSKIITIMSNMILQIKETIKGTQRMMIVTFLILILILLYENYQIKKANRDTTLVELVIKINVIIMVTLPMLNYAVDLFRIQRYALVFSYIAFSKYVTSEDTVLTKYSLNKLGYKIICLLVPLLGFYLNVYRSNLLENVVYPIFNSNILFNF